MFLYRALSLGRWWIGLVLLVCLGGWLASVRAEEEPPPLPDPPQLILETTKLDLGALPLGGEFTSDPVRGQVVCPEGKALLGAVLPAGQEVISLVWKDQGTGRTATIPLTWELRFRGGGRWSPWTLPVKGPIPDSQESALWWEIGKGEMRAYEWELRCRLSTDPWPLAGDYHADLRLIVVPLGLGTGNVARSRALVREPSSPLHRDKKSKRR